MNQMQPACSEGIHVSEVFLSRPFSNGRSTRHVITRFVLDSS
jgi:hypothetical protein